MSARSFPRPAFIAEDGRAVIVALDHGLGLGQVDGLNRPESLLRTLSIARPDGVIVPRGMGRMIGAMEHPLPWLLTADVYVTSTLPGTPGRDEVHATVWTAADAKALGAAGLKVLLVFGRADPEAFVDELRSVARLVSQAADAGLPVMVETVLWGPDVPIGRDDDAQFVVDAARTGFELGADVLKIAIPDDLGPLRELTSGLPIPIVLMGGPAADPDVTFRRIDAALDAGAAGVALGRNVWSRPNPDRFVAALHTLVHGRAPWNDAVAEIDA